MIDDPAPWREGGHRRPMPNGPRRYWMDVPPDEWAAGEWHLRHLRTIGARDIEGRHRDQEADLVRRLARPGRCQAAVEWYESGHWMPCRHFARNHGLCWTHGGWRDTMPKRNTHTAIDLDCEDDDAPEASVEIRLGTMTLGTMTRQLGRIKRAAADMGAPDDARILVQSYGDHTVATVKWSA